MENQKTLLNLLPPAWHDPMLVNALKSDYFTDLNQTLLTLETARTLRPQYDNIFKAFELTAPDHTKVVILGQDPYPGVNDAMGMSFSVNPGQAVPKSLQNVFKEIESDVGIKNTSGDLTNWAQQGVLLLNSTLTTEVRKSNAHRDSCWHWFSELVILKISRNAKTMQQPVVFLLWGKAAQQMASFVETSPFCHILSCPHPSPYSAHTGFFGCKHFSKTNEILATSGLKPINWSTY